MRRQVNHLQNEINNGKELLETTKASLLTTQVSLKTTTSSLTLATKARWDLEAESVDKTNHILRLQIELKYEKAAHMSTKASLRACDTTLDLTRTTLLSLRDLYAQRSAFLLDAPSPAADPDVEDRPAADPDVADITELRQIHLLLQSMKIHRDTLIAANTELTSINDNQAEDLRVIRRNFNSLSESASTSHDMDRIIGINHKHHTQLAIAVDLLGSKSNTIIDLECRLDSLAESSQRRVEDHNIHAAEQVALTLTQTTALLEASAASDSKDLKIEHMQQVIDALNDDNQHKVAIQLLLDQSALDTTTTEALEAKLRKAITSCTTRQATIDHLVTSNNTLKHSLETLSCSQATTFALASGYLIETAEHPSLQRLHHAIGSHSLLDPSQHQRCSSGNSC